MVAQPQAAGPRLHLTRIFAAPRERVFEAWTDPGALKHWMHPGGHETPDAQVDLRPGGRYRIGMRKLPGGQVFYVTGSYHEVRAPERLVYTWRWEHEARHGETLVTVEFRDLGGRTEVALTHERFVSDESRDSHGKGWGGCLDSLAGLLEG